MCPSSCSRRMRSSADFSSFDTAATISFWRLSLRLSAESTLASSCLLFCKISMRSFSSSAFAWRICASWRSRSWMVFWCVWAWARCSCAVCESFSTSRGKSTCRRCSASRAVLSVSSIWVCTNVSDFSAISDSFFWSFVCLGLSKLAMLSRLSSRKSHMTIKSDLLIFIFYLPGGLCF